MAFGLNKGLESHPEFRARFDEEPELGFRRQPAGLSWEAWDTLDPAHQEAILDGRLAPEELPELAGWLDEDEEGYGRS
jgi:hypothetical protein